MIKKLFKDTITYGISGLITKGLAWILLPIHAKALSTEDFGALDLILLFGSFVSITVALEVMQGLSRYWSEVNSEAERKLLASTALIFSVAMYLVFIIFALFFSKLLTMWLLGDLKYLETVKIGILYIGFNGIFLILLGQFRWELNSKKYSLISFVNSALTIFMLGYIYYLGEVSLHSVIIVNLISVIISIIFCAWNLRYRYILKFDFLKLKDLLQFSVPLVPAGIAIFINLYISRFFVSHYEGLEGVAHFSFSYRVSGLIILLIFALQTALMPLVYRFHAEKETPSQISKLFRWFVFAAIIGCLIISIFSKQLVTIFGDSKFISNSNLIIILTPAILISQMYIFSPGISIAKKTIAQLYVTLISCLAGMIANWILVPLFGLLGAGIANLLSSIIFLYLWFCIGQKYYYISYTKKNVLYAIILYIAFVYLDLYMQSLIYEMYLLVFFKIFLVFCQLGFMVIIGLVSFKEVNYSMKWLRQKVAA